MSLSPLTLLTPIRPASTVTSSQQSISTPPLQTEENLSIEDEFEDLFPFEIRLLNQLKKLNLLNEVCEIVNVPTTALPQTYEMTKRFILNLFKTSILCGELSITYKQMWQDVECTAITIVGSGIGKILGKQYFVDGLKILFPKIDLSRLDLNHLELCSDLDTHINSLSNTLRLEQKIAKMMTSRHFSEAKINVHYLNKEHLIFDDFTQMIEHFRLKENRELYSLFPISSIQVNSKERSCFKGFALADDNLVKFFEHLDNGVSADELQLFLLNAAIANAHAKGKKILPLFLISEPTFKQNADKVVDCHRLVMKDKNQLIHDFVIFYKSEAPTTRVEFQNCRIDVRPFLCGKDSLVLEGSWQALVDKSLKLLRCTNPSHMNHTDWSFFWLKISQGYLSVNPKDILDLNKAFSISYKLNKSTVKGCLSTIRATIQKIQPPNPYLNLFYIFNQLQGLPNTCTIEDVAAIAKELKKVCLENPLADHLLDPLIHKRLTYKEVAHYLQVCSWWFLLSPKKVRTACFAKVTFAQHAAKPAMHLKLNNAVILLPANLEQTLQTFVKNYQKDPFIDNILHCFGFYIPYRFDPKLPVGVPNMIEAAMKMLETKKELLIRQGYSLLLLENHLRSSNHILWNLLSHLSAFWNIESPSARLAAVESIEKGLELHFTSLPKDELKKIINGLKESCEKDDFTEESFDFFLFILLHDSSDATIAAWAMQIGFGKKRSLSPEEKKSASTHLNQFKRFSSALSYARSMKKLSIEQTEEWLSSLKALLRKHVKSILNSANGVEQMMAFASLMPKDSPIPVNLFLDAFLQDEIKLAEMYASAFISEGAISAPWQKFVGLFHKVSSNQPYTEEELLDAFKLIASQAKSDVLCIKLAAQAAKKSSLSSTFWGIYFKHLYQVLGIKNVLQTWESLNQSKMWNSDNFNADLRFFADLIDVSDQNKFREELISFFRAKFPAYLPPLLVQQFNEEERKLRFQVVLSEISKECFSKNYLELISLCINPEEKKQAIDILEQLRVSIYKNKSVKYEAFQLIQSPKVHQFFKDDPKPFLLLCSQFISASQQDEKRVWICVPILINFLQSAGCEDIENLPHNICFELLRKASTQEHMQLIFNILEKNSISLYLWVEFLQKLIDLDESVIKHDFKMMAYNNIVLLTPSTTLHISHFERLQQLYFALLVDLCMNSTSEEEKRQLSMEVMQRMSVMVEGKTSFTTDLLYSQDLKTGYEYLLALAKYILKDTFELAIIDADLPIKEPVITQSSIRQFIQLYYSEIVIKLLNTSHDFFERLASDRPEGISIILAYAKISFHSNDRIICAGGYRAFCSTFTQVKPKDLPEFISIFILLIKKSYEMRLSSEAEYDQLLPNVIKYTFDINLMNRFDALPLIDALVTCPTINRLSSAASLIILYVQSNFFNKANFTKATPLYKVCEKLVDRLIQSKPEEKAHYHLIGFQLLSTSFVKAVGDIAFEFQAKIKFACVKQHFLYLDQFPEIAENIESHFEQLVQKIYPRLDEEVNPAEPHETICVSHPFNEWDLSHDHPSQDQIFKSIFAGFNLMMLEYRNVRQEKKNANIIEEMYSMFKTQALSPYVKNERNLKLHFGDIGYLKRNLFFLSDLIDLDLPQNNATLPQIYYIAFLFFHLMSNASKEKQPYLKLLKQFALSKTFSAPHLKPLHTQIVGLLYLYLAAVGKKTIHPVALAAPVLLETVKGSEKDLENLKRYDFSVQQNHVENACILTGIVENLLTHLLNFQSTPTNDLAIVLIRTSKDFMPIEARWKWYKKIYLSKVGFPLEGTGNEYMIPLMKNFALFFLHQKNQPVHAKEVVRNEMISILNDFSRMKKNIFLLNNECEHVLFYLLELIIDPNKALSFRSDDDLKEKLLLFKQTCAVILGRIEDEIKSHFDNPDELEILLKKYYKLFDFVITNESVRNILEEEIYAMHASIMKTLITCLQDKNRPIIPKHVRLLLGFSMVAQAGKLFKLLEDYMNHIRIVFEISLPKEHIHGMTDCVNVVLVFHALFVISLNDTEFQTKAYFDYIDLLMKIDSPFIKFLISEYVYKDLKGNILFQRGSQERRSAIEKACSSFDLSQMTHSSIVTYQRIKKLAQQIENNEIWFNGKLFTLH